MRFFTVKELREIGAKVSDKEFAKMMLMQEIRMWKHIGKPVQKEDFDFICERRGFSKGNVKVLREVLKRLNLGENL